MNVCEHCGNCQGWYYIYRDVNEKIKAMNEIDTYTEWSSGLYIPWVYMFEKKLENKSHTLKLRIPKGERTECVIRDFVVNQPE